MCLLAIDFVLFPDFLEDRFAQTALSASELVHRRRVDMGKYHVHRLTVSWGRIGDATWTTTMGGDVTAVAVSAFSASGMEGVAIGPLTKALLGVLPDTDTTALVQLIQDSPTFSPGKVQVVALKRSPSTQPTPHFVFLLRAKRGADRDAKDALKAGIAELFQQTAIRSASTLWLPPLTVDPGEQDSPSFEEFFAYLFEALRTSASPRHVDISLFDEWPTPQLETAVRAFNGHWTAVTEARNGAIPKLYRLQLRLLLVGLALALFVSGRSVTLTPKAASIIAGAYALMLLGSFKTIETLADGLSDDLRVTAMAVMTVGAAIGFPSIVQWSARDLFSKAP